MFFGMWIMEEFLCAIFFLGICNVMSTFDEIIGVFFLLEIIREL